MQAPQSQRVVDPGHAPCASNSGLFWGVPQGGRPQKIRYHHRKVPGNPARVAHWTQRYSVIEAGQVLRFLPAEWDLLACCPHALRAVW